MESHSSCAYDFLFINGLSTAAPTRLRHPPLPSCVSRSILTTRWQSQGSTAWSPSPQALALRPPRRHPRPATVAVANVRPASWAAQRPLSESSRGKPVWSSLAAPAPSAAAALSTTATCWRPRTARLAIRPAALRWCWVISGSAPPTPASSATRSSGSSITRSTHPTVTAGTSLCWSWTARSPSPTPFLPSACQLPVRRTPAPRPSPAATVVLEPPNLRQPPLNTCSCLSGVRAAALTSGASSRAAWSALAAIPRAACRSAMATAAARWWPRSLAASAWSESSLSASLAPLPTGRMCTLVWPRRSPGSPPTPRTPTSAALRWPAFYRSAVPRRSKTGVDANMLFNCFLMLLERCVKVFPFFYLGRFSIVSIIRSRSYDAIASWLDVLFLVWPVALFCAEFVINAFIYSLCCPFNKNDQKETLSERSERAFEFTKGASRTKALTLP